MPTRDEWIAHIKETGGKPGRGVQLERILAVQEELGGSWFYYKPADASGKADRDRIAREMRKDGWVVKTETNSLGWFLCAVRAKTNPEASQ